MAVVEETIISDVKVNGYPIEGTVYYVYCDRCGSFKIRPYLSVLHWLSLVIVIVVSATFWNRFILSKYTYQNIGCWGMYALILIIGLSLLAKYLPHKCMKCGSKNISNRDVLHYSKRENVLQIIDVPEYRLHKHNEKHISLLNDLGSLPIIFLAILGVMLMPFLILIAIIYEIIREFFFDKE